MIFSYSKWLPSPYHAWTISQEEFPKIKSEHFQEGISIKKSLPKNFLTEFALPANTKMFPLKQVHSDEISVIDEDFIGSEEEADALLTDQENCLLCIRTADCLPIFISDKFNKVAGLVHAGWRGTKEQIIQKVIAKISKDYEVNLSHLSFLFGPSIRQFDYEVSEEFKEYFPSTVDEYNGKFYFDLNRENIRQIKEMGVSSKQIFDLGLSTYLDLSLESYRRDKEQAGRMYNLIMMTSQ